MGGLNGMLLRNIRSDRNSCDVLQQFTNLPRFTSGTMSAHEHGRYVSKKLSEKEGERFGAGGVPIKCEEDASFRADALQMDVVSTSVSSTSSSTGIKAAIRDWVRDMW